MVSRGRLGLRELVAADTVAALALVAFAILRIPGADVPLRAPDFGVLGWAMAATLGLPLAVRRLWPVPVLLAVTAVGAVAVVTGIAGDAVAFAIAAALYPVGLSAERWRSPALPWTLGPVIVTGLAVALIPGLPVIDPPPDEESFSTTPVTTLLSCTVIIVGSWTIARAVRERRHRAEQLAELRADRAVAQERLRIARDLHDVVGHNLSLIAMKAAVATHVADGRPDEPAAALRAIEKVSRAALDDVRAVLGALRDPDGTPPDIAGIDTLIADARTAGITVHAEVLEPVGLPAAVQSSAYRIVQEALTNVRRHAGPATCRVTVAAADGAVAVTVVDDGTPDRGAGSQGHGLAGMHERVAVHGGTLRVGPQPGGGFAVRARLPFDRPAPSPPDRTAPSPQDRPAPSPHDPPDG